MNRSYPVRPRLLTRIAFSDRPVLKVHFSASCRYLYAVFTGDLTAIIDLHRDGLVIALRGSLVALSQDDETMALSHSLSQTLSFVSTAYVHSQLLMLAQCLETRSLVALDKFFKRSLIHPSTRFLASCVPTNKHMTLIGCLGVHDLLSYWTTHLPGTGADGLSDLLDMFPNLYLLNLGHAADSGLRSAVTIALNRVMIDELHTLVTHTVRNIQHIELTNAEYLYFVGLSWSRLLPMLASADLQVANRVLSELVVDVTLPTDNRGPRDSQVIDCTWIAQDTTGLDATLSHVRRNEIPRSDASSCVCTTPALPEDRLVRHQVSLLPNLVNTEYWRSTNQKDIFNALLEADAIESFDVAVVRSTLNYRWGAVRKLYWAYFLLYLTFLVCCTAFCLHVSRDDVSDSLREFYVQANEFVFAAIGVGVLLLNIWFTYSEIVVMMFEKMAYWKSLWSYGVPVTVFLVYLLLILHVARSNAQGVVAALVTTMVWLNMVPFLRAFRGTGMFLVFVGDTVHTLRYFLTLWLLMLAGFGCTMAVILRTHISKDSAFATAMIGLLSGAPNSLAFALHDQEHDDDDPFLDVQYMYRTQLSVFVVFIVVSVVLLLSALRAILITSVPTPGSRAQQIGRYRFYKAHLVLRLEHVFGRTGDKTERHAWLHMISAKTSTKIVGNSVSGDHSSISHATRPISTARPLVPSNAESVKTKIAEPFHRIPSLRIEDEQPASQRNTLQPNQHANHPLYSSMMSSVTSINSHRQSSLHPTRISHGRDDTLQFLLLESRTKAEDEANALRGQVSDLHAKLASLTDMVSKLVAVQSARSDPPVRTSVSSLTWTPSINSASVA